jgi:hypothetical protein
MILAIRAFRATIFAFNDAIEVAIAAVASVTDAVADSALAESTDGPAPVVPEIFHSAVADAGALKLTFDVPPSEDALVFVELWNCNVLTTDIDVLNAPVRIFAWSPSNAGFPAESFKVSVATAALPCE